MYRVLTFTSKCVRGGIRSRYVQCLCTAVTAGSITIGFSLLGLSFLVLLSVSILLVWLSLFFREHPVHDRYAVVPRRAGATRFSRVLIGLLVLDLTPVPACSPLQMQGDRKITSFLASRQSVDLHTLSGTQLRTKILSDVAGISGWAEHLFTTKLFVGKTIRSEVSCLFLAGLWQVLVDRPSIKFLEALHDMQRALIPQLMRSGIPHDVAGLVLSITTVMTLVRIRLLAVSGRRQRWKARRLCHSLHPCTSEALLRPAEAKFHHVADLVQLLQTQIMCIDGSDLGARGSSSFLYQLGSEALYIGRGSIVRAHGQASGGIGRFREHVRGILHTTKGLPIKESSRYHDLRAGCLAWLLFLFILVAPTAEIAGLESAHIMYANPSANNLPNVRLGRARARNRTHPRRRRGRRARRLALATSPIPHNETEKWMEDRISRLCSRFHGHLRYLRARYTWQDLLRLPFKDLYYEYQNRQHARDGTVGPVYIYMHSSTLSYF